MSEKKTSRTKKLARVMVLILGIAVVYAIAQPTMRKWRLESACAEADRVVVDLNTWPDMSRARNNVPTLPCFEVKGRDKVQELLKAITLEHDLPTVQCRCFGEVLFRVYHQDQPLASLSLHHERSLRWRDGKWVGDADLTEKSRAALSDWMQKNGCPSIQEAARLSGGIWKAWEEERDRREEQSPSTTQAAGK
jgi:hypothetical protein